MAAAQRHAPPPEHLRDRPILRKKVWERMHRKDKNFMGIVCGETGSGKSEFGLRLCELIDPDFGPEQIAFSIGQFLRLVNQDAPVGSAILFDEVGIALSHAKHYEDDVIRVNHILQSWREQNRMLIMTAPHINLIHKPDRGLLHAQMDMQAIDRQAWLSRARYRNIQQNTDDGELYKKYPRLRDPETGRRTCYESLTLYKPSPELVEPYLEKKRAFNDQLNQDVLDQVTPDEAEEARTPKEIAEDIIDDGDFESVVGWHGGHNRPMFKKQLIRAEYNLSHSEADTVKSVLEREASDVLSDFE